MGYYFSLQQLTDFSKQFEGAGFDFYSHLAGRVKDEKVKEVLQFLADQETDHIKGFATLLEGANANDREREYAIDVAGMLGGMIADLKNSVFGFRDLEIDKINLKACFEIALRLEESSVKVYSAIRDSFGDEFRDILTEIITEEQSHADMLRNVMTKAQLR